MGNETIDYYQIKPLEGIYLEDSYVLGLVIGLEKTVISLELVLDETHPEYREPLQGEQYCYRKGKIIFYDYSGVNLSNIRSVASLDASGERDFGNIDYLRMTGKDFDVGGEWGDLRIRKGILELELDSTS